MGRHAHTAHIHTYTHTHMPSNCDGQQHFGGIGPN